MRFLWLVVACAFVACGLREANVQHEPALEFGNVSVGASQSATLRLTNTGERPAQLTLTLDSGDFALDDPALTVPAGETKALTVHFAPRALGPRVATLELGATTVALSGRGLGPSLSVAREVTLGPLVMVTGQPSEPLNASLTLRNAGTSGSLLRLGAPRVEGSGELCVGTSSNSGCVPWQPPAVLGAQTLLEVPLSILPTSAGPKQWTVTLPSNDPLSPEVVIVVRALVESFEPCNFSAPSELVFAHMGVLTIRHLGPGTCLVRDLLVNPPDLLRLSPPLRVPLRLESNRALTITLVPEPNAPPRFPGFVRVVAAGTPNLDVPVRREVPLTECLTVAPSTVDFGVVPMRCSSAARNFQVYNTCAATTVIERLTIASAAGEAPGGPNCPGTFACPEFLLLSGVAPGTPVMSGNDPVGFSVKYRPINYGPDTGAVVITTRGGLEYVVALQGRGDLNSQRTDTFRQDALARSDVLVMVDASPSFVTRRQSVRDNLMPLLRSLSGACIDGRIAFAAADGDPDAGVRLQPNDAGASWTSSREPAFVERALSAFDALPVGSEIEACIGPAADLIDDAGVRDGGVFAGLCVTDALESTPNPQAALQRLRQQARQVSWSSIAAYGGSCGAEALDDGVHASLVSASNGLREDLCVATWGNLFEFGTTGCGYRTTFFLSSRPGGPLEVRVEGVLVSEDDWTYDATNNAVTFLPAFVPPPGSTTTVSYSVSCVP